MESLPANQPKIEGLKRVAEKVRPNRKAAASEKVIDITLHARARQREGGLQVKPKRRSPGLSPAERGQLVLEFRMKARKLARSILRKWHARLDLLEVDSVVDLSLCEAVKRYDPRKGASFMTFLFYHLRGNLIRAVSVAASMNAIPSGDGEHELLGSSRRGKAGHGVSAMEVAEALCNHDHILPDEALFRKEMTALSSAACEKLDALEREVIYRIYVKEQQLIDIAHTLGYSRCHISRVKRKALDALCDNLALSVQGEMGTELDELRKKLAESGPALECRRVHRRRPRSKKALEERERRSLHRFAAAA